MYSLFSAATHYSHYANLNKQIVLGTHTNNKLVFNSCYIIYIGYNICKENVETHL